MLITTPRLGMRELTEADLPALRSILQDPETMTAYEGPFDEGQVRAWLERMEQRYREDGFGLWAVVRKSDGKTIGQCGITWQEIDGHRVHEVGYLFNREYWHSGYATEAARAAVEYAIAGLGATRVYAQVRDTNIASMNVAIRLGMTVRTRFIKHYRGIDMPHLAFAIDAHDFERSSRRRHPVSRSAIPLPAEEGGEIAGSSSPFGELNSRERYREEPLE